MKIKFLLFFFSFTFPGLTLGQISQLSADVFQKTMLSNQAQILDVRTIEEFNQSHIKGAFLADWYKPNLFKERINHLDKTKPVMVYCQTGIRSAKASKQLKNAGFKQVYDLRGGLISWKKNDKPVQEKISQKQLSKKEYMSQISVDGYVMVDFGAKWCPPCKKMEPVIEAYHEKNKGHFQLIKIDGGEQTEILGPLKVNAFPTIIIYKDGKEIRRKTGLSSETDLARLLDLKN